MSPPLRSNSRFPSATPPPSKIPTIRLIHATPSTTAPSPDETLLSPNPPPRTSGGSQRGPQRKTVTKKKSKPGLLSGTRRNDDFSDITRRLGLSNTPSGADIYVDPSNDPDIGEIVVVKKEKARGKLDSIRWALGDKTNSGGQNSEKEEKSKKKDKAKGEEKDRWWTLGRGRKDSKEKENKSKSRTRSKSPAPSSVFAALPVGQGGLPTPPPSARPSPPPRHGSLSSGALLSEHWRAGSPSPSPASRAPTPVSIVPMPDEAKDTRNGGSLAIRAMRSMRSFARLGTWAQLSNPAPTRRAKDSSDTTSSWEAGEPSVVRSLFRSSGLDGSLRRSRTSKQSSSTQGSQLPVEMSGRPSTVNRLSSLSTASSLAPVSTYSGDSRSSKTSTDSNPDSHRLSTHSNESEVAEAKRASATPSIRWDDNIETVKAKRRGARERRGGTTVAVRQENAQKSSQRSLEARQRGKLSNIFPEVLDGTPFPPKLVTASNSHPEQDAVPSPELPPGTPPKKARPRPHSEQLLGRTDRPQGVVPSEDGDVVISILNAATSDLAQLINRLDLQATPDASGFTPGSRFGSREPTGVFGTPAKRPDDVTKTPSKKSPRESDSITSLRPYRVRDSTATGESTSNYGPVFSLPDKATESEVVSGVPQPAVVEDMEPVFSRGPVALPSLSVLKPPGRSRPNLRVKESKISMHKSKPSLAALAAALQPDSQMPVEVQVQAPKSDEEASAQGHSECSSKVSCPSSLPPKIKTREELREEIGYNGTFGDLGEDIVLTDDPDSDIPEELHEILKRGSYLTVDDTLSYGGSPLGRAIGSPSELPPEEGAPNLSMSKKSPGPNASPCPGLPPAVPLPPITNQPPPVFKALLIDDQDREAALTGSEPSSPYSGLDNDTKKTFDFTGEINKLNASGEANRLSFLEQLEAAFPDPAKLQSFDIGRSLAHMGLLSPETSINESRVSIKRSIKADETSNQGMQYTEPTQFEDIVPSALSPAFQLSQESTQGSGISPLLMQNVSAVPGVRLRHSIISRSSDSELSWAFQKDGVKSLAGPMLLTQEELPLLRRSRSASSIVEEDSSVLKSIYGHAVPVTEGVPPLPVVPRQRLISDTSSKRVVRENTLNSHQRTGSEVSFAGFDTFSEIRAKFEFMNEQSNYFPEIDTSRKKHTRQESVFSIASVSSYGQVISGGLRDPFGYSFHSRPPSEDLTGSVNDTFSFLKQDPHQRRLSTDSDISSFYFRPGQGQRRGHRVNESIASVLSANGPPVSIYNRSHGQSFGHSRTDSWASISSLAHAYGSGGASGGRAAWARHCRDSSISVQSIEFSAKRLGRPGIGDKMFSSRDPAIPLTAISASPPESGVGNSYSSGLPSQDSIFDEQRASADSIFDKTRNRSSASSDSIFGHDYYAHARLRPQATQFRPISMLSSESSESRKEDDTMLTMLNGDHVRRRSIGSSFEASPCMRVEKHLRETKIAPAATMQRTLETIPSVQFGEGRMELAKKGLLERQSLEASCLVADGEELDRSGGPPTITLNRLSPMPPPRPDSLLSESEGATTPPLCASESEGSQSSIDTQHLDALLTNATQPTPTVGRLRPRGHGHRRGRSQISSTSAFSSIMTIEEEAQITQIQSEHLPSPVFDSCGATFNSLSPEVTMSRNTSTIYIVEEDEETGEVLRKYWALCSEADETLAQSQVIWPDTAFSLYALQSFMPPHEPEAMKAMLEHSRTVFGPLPMELRVRRTRSRTSSRASPYPQPRCVSRSRESSASPSSQPESTSPILQVLQSIPMNTPARMRKLSVSRNGKTEKTDDPTPVKSIPRQRVPSNARRAALGWSKRKPDGAKSDRDKSFANKENIVSEAVGGVFSPNQSLRIVRPRPRGRVR